MKIIKIKDLEDCFDGSFMKEVLFDSSITKDFIFFCGSNGKLDYYPNFLRPFFRVDVKEKYIIKGVEGNKTMRLILNRKNIKNALNQFINSINNFN